MVSTGLEVLEEAHLRLALIITSITVWRLCRWVTPSVPLALSTGSHTPTGCLCVVHIQVDAIWAEENGQRAVPILDGPLNGWYVMYTAVQVILIISLV